MSTKIEKQQAALERRIHRFYEYLNRRAFDRSYEMIDPRLRDKSSSVTLFQYQSAILQFVEWVGPLKILEISLALHMDEPSQFYEGRDFAVGRITSLDGSGEQRILSERWVRQGPSWYTRSTGFIAPEAGWAPPQARDERGKRRRLIEAKRHPAISDKTGPD
jgi:hypothetical protein